MGATDEAVVIISVPCGAAMALTDKFKYVELSATGQVTVANADTDIVFGVLYSGLPTTAAGENVGVAISGKVKTLNGATLANAGVLVQPDATGRNQAAVTGDRSAGILMTAGGAAGETVEVLLRPVGHLIA